MPFTSEGETKTSGRLAREYLTKFPSASIRQLARMLHAEHGRVFGTYNSARQVLRFHSGTIKAGPGRTVSAPIISVRRTGPSMPASLATDYAPFALGGFVRALVMGDIHVPWHNRTALDIAVKHGRRMRVDLVLLNGDALDFYALSKFERDPSEVDFPRELQLGRELLEWIRDRFPKARIVMKVGNHDERLEHYMWRKAPELVGCEEFELKQLLRCADYGVEVVPAHLYMTYRHLNIMHGQEFGRAMSSPVNPARGATMKARECVMVAHEHRTSEHVDVTIRGTQIAGWSLGCLCDLHPRYRPINQWNHGFAVIHAGEGDAWRVENHRIIDGMVV